MSVINFKHTAQCHIWILSCLQLDLGKTCSLNNPRQRINISILLSRVDLDFHSQITLYTSS